MCGICGVWEYGATAGRRVEQSLVERMRDQMAHRGPDDAGATVLDEGRLGFGHRRLSIVDLSCAGHQPMRGCDARDVHLIFNGEIYNHRELRAELEARGHEYRSQTDTETILHLYEERGLDFVHELRGDFALALWDGGRERLVLVRDPVGVKPLYYYQRNGRLIFASEIKAMLAHPSITPELDESAVYHYLTFLTAPAPQTLFADVRKLPAGCLLVCGRNGDTKVERYWDALPSVASSSNSKMNSRSSASATRQSHEANDAGTLEDIKGGNNAAQHKAEILRLLRASIKRRMMSDVPFGVFLSGGVDSSANVALMAEEMSQPVRTFTVGFRDAPEMNEFAQARDIAQRFQTDHHEVLIGQDEMLKFLPELIFHQDEPIADPVCVPLYYVAKLARESGTTVVQVGEGADEIFSGYDNYVRHLAIHENFWRHATRLPRFARRAAYRTAAPLLEAMNGKRVMIDMLRRLAHDEPLFWGGAIVFDEAFKPRVLSERMRREFTNVSSVEVVNQHLERISDAAPQSDFLTRMIYLELKLRLPELLLMRVDKITMATSVEARVPFLDQDLVRYAMNVPRSLKVRGKSGKHILKQALETVLPHEILYRRKRGFGAPIAQWLRDDKNGLLKNHLLNSTLRERDLFDYKFIARLVEEHQRGARDWSFHLWTLLNLSLWYERWIDAR